jgi:hypothetical protein
MAVESHSSVLVQSIYKRCDESSGFGRCRPSPGSVDVDNVSEFGLEVELDVEI